MIKLGLFPGVFEMNRFEAMARAGYDFAEFAIENIIDMTDSEFAKLKKLLSDSNLEVIALSNPYPSTKNIIAPEFDFRGFQEKFKLAAARGVELGCKYIIYAHGNVRMMPIFGKGIQEHRALVFETMRLAAETASSEGLMMLIEITSKNRTNFCNTFAEAVGLCKEIGSPKVATMCDLRHFMSSGEPYENMVLYKEYIKHIHIDYPYDEFPTRKFPTLNDDFDYAPFFDAIKRMDYSGGISVEARSYDDYERQITEGLEFFKHFGHVPAKKRT